MLERLPRTAAVLFFVIFHWLQSTFVDQSDRAESASWTREMLLARVYPLSTDIEFVPANGAQELTA
jgi:hypothetical protein